MTRKCVCLLKCLRGFLDAVVPLQVSPSSPATVLEDSLIQVVSAPSTGPARRRPHWVLVFLSSLPVPIHSWLVWKTKMPALNAFKMLKEATEDYGGQPPPLPCCPV